MPVKTIPKRQENFASEYWSVLHNVSCMIFLWNFQYMLYRETQIKSQKSAWFSYETPVVGLQCILWIQIFLQLKMACFPFLITQLMTCVIWDNERWRI